MSGAGPLDGREPEARGDALACAVLASAALGPVGAALNASDGSSAAEEDAAADPTLAPPLKEADVAEEAEVAVVAVAVPGASSDERHCAGGPLLPAPGAAKNGTREPLAPARRPSSSIRRPSPALVPPEPQVGERLPRVRPMPPACVGDTEGPSAGCVIHAPFADPMSVVATSNSDDERTRGTRFADAAADAIEVPSPLSDDRCAEDDAPGWAPCPSRRVPWKERRDSSASDSASESDSTSDSEACRARLAADPPTDARRSICDSAPGRIGAPESPTPRDAARGSIPERLERPECGEPTAWRSRLPRSASLPVNPS